MHIALVYKEEAGKPQLLICVLRPSNVVSGVEVYSRKVLQSSRRPCKSVFNNIIKVTYTLPNFTSVKKPWLFLAIYANICGWGSVCVCKISTWVDFCRKGAIFLVFFLIGEETI